MAKREWEAEMRAESSAAKLSRRLRGLELPGAQLYWGAEHMIRLAEEALRETEAATATFGVVAAQAATGTGSQSLPGNTFNW